MKRILFSGLVAALALSGSARAGEVLVQTVGDTFHADTGESGTNTTATAKIIVSLTLKGRPLNEQGPTTGDGTTEIALPGGWLMTPVSLPTGVCEAVPVKFTNEGRGIYTIELAPPPDTPACTWQSGKYVVVVLFVKGSNRGTSIAEFTVP